MLVTQFYPTPNYIICKGVSIGMRGKMYMKMWDMVTIYVNVNQSCPCSCFQCRCDVRKNSPELICLNAIQFCNVPYMPERLQVAETENALLSAECEPPSVISPQLLPCKSCIRSPIADGTICIHESSTTT